MQPLELSSSVFSILSGLIEERVGLHYDSNDRELLQEKASSRALEAGFDSLLDYYYYLRYDPGGEQEISQLVENLVVGETYFFREWPAIEVLVDSFLAPWCAEGRRPRVLSVPCSTGEEPLSLAMLLHDRQLLGKVEIVAADISAKAIAKARQGRFSKRAVRQVPRPDLQERFIRSDKDGHQVGSDLIDRIHWNQANLLSDKDFAGLGAFDVILCRNVLIYFSDQTVRSVLDRLSRALIPGGVLMVGVSESLLRYGSPFVGEERGGTFVYRKAST